jgi:hypothetical protein
MREGQSARSTRVILIAGSVLCYLLVLPVLIFGFFLSMDGDRLDQIFITGWWAGGSLLCGSFPRFAWAEYKEGRSRRALIFAFTPIGYCAALAIGLLLGFFDSIHRIVHW